ncbi:MAG: hypothetical protein ACI8P0_003620, partial [Planctomycetaceae bacterium]
MLLSSWLKRISDRIRSRRYQPDRKPKKPDRFTQLGLTRLEDRVVLTASAVFSGFNDLLVVDVDQEDVTISTNGGRITVTGSVTGALGAFTAVNVQQIIVNDTNAGVGSGAVDFTTSNGSDFVLFKGVFVSADIETAVINTGITATSNGNTVDINAGTLQLNADVIANAGSILLAGDVVLGEGQNVTLSTGATTGQIQIDGSLNGTGGGASEALVITAGTGDVVLNNVGMAGADDLESLTVTSATSATISGAVDVNSSLTITAGTASLNDDVSSGNLQIITTANTTVTGTVNSSGTIDLDAATFTQNGAITAQDSVTIDVANPLVLNQNLTSGGATTITVTADDNGAVPFTLSSGVTLSSASGMLTIQADDMNLSGTVAAAGQIVLLRQNSDGEVIELGGTGITDNELELAVAEIDSVTASILRIGHIAAGNINLTQEVSPANSATLSLLSGGSVADIVAGGIGATNLAIQATGTVTLDNVRNVEALAASVTGAGSSFVFGNEDDGFV